MQRPPTHVDGELGEAIFLERMLRLNWLLTKLTPDYGFDYLGQPTEGGAVTTNFALFQVKASANQETGQSSVRIEKKQIDLWRDLPVPAFIANVDPRTSLVLLRSCQEFTATLPDVTTQTKTIAFPESATLTSALERQVRTAVIEFWTSMRTGLGEATAALLGVLTGGIAGIMPVSVGGLLWPVIGSYLRRFKHWPGGVPQDVPAFKQWLHEYVRKRR